MSIFSSLGKLLKAIFTKLLTLIKKILKAIWPILLIAAIIYFAPAAVGFLTSAGAPAWLTGSFQWIATNLTPGLMSGLEWLTSGAGSLLSKGWTAFKGLELGTQLAIVGGAAAAIAPEETADVLEEAGKTVGEVTGAVASGIGSALFSSPWVLLAAGVAVWYFFIRDENDDEVTGDRLGGPSYVA